MQDDRDIEVTRYQVVRGPRNTWLVMEIVTVTPGEITLSAKEVARKDTYYEAHIRCRELNADPPKAKLHGT
jgi:hypothetical protein